MPVQAVEAPRIAVASSLQFVIPALLEAFKIEAGFAPRISFGSSGNFRRQISQGAPFEMFMSADESYIDALASAQLTEDKGEVYALGQLALIGTASTNMALGADLSFLHDLIKNGDLRHFAIANPDHAPYGRAARETLVSLGLWETMQPYLIRGENASQALQFALSGSSQGGLVPYSLTFSPAVRASSDILKIDSAHHQPIRQRMVLLKNAGVQARQFYMFISGKSAQRILEAYGYQIPPLEK
ncbi:MAG: molybdate ABC transporter substrate-binding protein [Gammaproteobacteria bacterium]|nr:molybdate ABC transporter substrate-binding protein [Gammaproteobacteria bacterium]